MTTDSYVLSIRPCEADISPRDYCNLGTIYAKHRRYSLSDDGAEPICKNFHGVFMPVYMYEHSGIALSTGPFSCPWDSGLLGVIYVSMEKLNQEYGWKKLNKVRIDKVKKILQSEIETYSHYLNGSVYGYVLEKNGNEIDSCYGFFGYDHTESGLMESLPEEWHTAENKKIIDN